MRSKRSAEVWSRRTAPVAPPRMLGKRESARPRLCARDLVAVRPEAADRSGPERHRIGRVRDQWWHSEPENRGKGDERAAPGNRVDGTRNRGRRERDQESEEGIGWHAGEIIARAEVPSAECEVSWSEKWEGRSDGLTRHCHLPFPLPTSLSTSHLALGTSFSRVRPSRRSYGRRAAPGSSAGRSDCAATARRSSAADRTLFPSTCRITSPSWSPAAAAAPSGSTSVTASPSVDRGTSSRWARLGVRGSTVMPSPSSLGAAPSLAVAAVFCSANVTLISSGLLSRMTVNFAGVPGAVDDT